MNIRIVHVILTPRLSGAEMLVYHLSLGQQGMGRAVTVLACFPMEASYEVYADSMIRAGVSLVFPNKPTHRFERLHWLFIQISKIQASIIYAHSVLPSLYVRLTVWFKRIPVVSVLHDASQDDYASSLYLWPEKHILPVPMAVVTVAPEAAINYIRRTGYTGKLLTIANGVCLNEIRSHAVNRKKVRELVFQLDDELVPVVLQVGRINPIKRQIETLRALEVLHAQGRFSGRLVFVGLLEDHDYVNVLNAAIEQSNLREGIIMLGPRTDIYDLLAASDIYAMPSISEGFSVAFLEALASGISVVGTNIPAFQFARSLPGVRLFNEVGENDYVSVLSAMISGKPLRTLRALSECDFTNTLKAYNDLTECLLNAHIDTIDYRI